jgi:hypothetical protein
VIFFLLLPFTFFLALSSDPDLGQCISSCRIFRRRRVRSTDYSSFDPAKCRCFEIVSFTHATAAPHSLQRVLNINARG